MTRPFPVYNNTTEKQYNHLADNAIHTDSVTKRNMSNSFMSPKLVTTFHMGGGVVNSPYQCNATLNPQVSNVNHNWLSRAEFKSPIAITQKLNCRQSTDEDGLQSYRV